MTILTFKAKKVKFTVQHCTLADCSSETLQSLMEMTLPSAASEMRKTIIYWTDEYSRINVVIAKNSAGKDIGWAVRRPWREGQKSHTLVMVYVKPLYRDRGIGRVLVKELSQEPICGWPWDPVSFTFFSKVGIPSRFDLNI